MGVLLCEHSVRGVSRIQRNTSGEVATLLQLRARTSKQNPSLCFTEHSSYTLVCVQVFIKPNRCVTYFYQTPLNWLKSGSK